MSLLEELALQDALTSSESTHYETGNWHKLPWEESRGLTAGASGAFFRAYSAGEESGAYWSAREWTGGAAAFTRSLGSDVAERYWGFWLCMTPGSHNGYQVRYTLTTTELYKATIYRCTAGTLTELGSSATRTAHAAETFYCWNDGGTIEAWIKESGGALVHVLSEADSTYSSGFIGLVGAGSDPSFTNFSAAASAGTLLGMVV